MPRARSVRRLAAASLLFAAGASVVPTGCSLLVSGDLSDVHCKAEGVAGPPACPGDAVCHAGLCVANPAPLSKLTMPCAIDGDCRPGEICLDPTSFGGTGPAVCSRTCCSSSECDAPPRSLVCWASTTGGGRFCRSTSDLGIGAIGTFGALHACAMNSDCRSGVCQGGVCLDTCCADVDCSSESSAPGTCQLTTSGGSGAWSCGPVAAPMKTGYLEPCAADGDCMTGLCLPIAGAMRCSMPCCGSVGCGAIDRNMMTSLLACDAVMHGGSVIRACSMVLPRSATGSVGTACTGDEQCRGGICGQRASGDAQCSDPCCVDTDCGDPAFACVPRAEGTTWALQCARK